MIGGLFRFFGRIARRGGARSRLKARTGGRAKFSKAAISEAARRGAGRGFGDGEREVSFAEEAAMYRADGIEAKLFRQLPRPKLTEGSAAEMDIAEAHRYSRESARFYNYSFPLFRPAEWFYEEIEEEFLDEALGRSEHGDDTRFLEILDIFRCTVNANTRNLFVWRGAILSAILLAIGSVVAAKGWYHTDITAIVGTSTELAHLGFIYGLCVTIGLAITLVQYYWFYRVVQQQNILHLDNYITSKFSRISNNFEVAKNRALNAERGKRMAQAAEMEDEAGSWTITYHWLAMRLLLDEMAIRNRFYQISRNSHLYNLLGVIINLVAWGANGLFIYFFLSASAAQVIALTMATTILIGTMWIILHGAPSMIVRTVQNNEWSRFSVLNLRKAIGDQVAEDKVQILTFRDRNRME